MDRGTAVRVVRGRKVAIGTTGTVCWYGTGQYGARVGIRLADGSAVFTDAKNVEAGPAAGPAAPAAPVPATARRAAIEFEEPTPLATVLTPAEARITALETLLADALTRVAALEALAARAAARRAALTPDPASAAA